MRSKIKFLLLLLFTTHLGFSQQAFINPPLWRATHEEPVSTRVVSLMVQGDPAIVEQKTKALGGTFKFSLKNISSISLPLNQVIALAQTHGIEKVEGLYGTGKLMDEKTLINANVNPVHNGAAPLTQGYDGSGVVVAILDDGVDYHHPDFQNADGTTRIKYIWDQNDTTTIYALQPYGYGREWTSADINNGTCYYFETTGEYGHGSNVTGIAAGNGLAINNYEGVAPKADIIGVAIKFDESFLNNVVNATQYCFEKAAALGEPCVVNASLGTYAGSHDGTDLIAQMIDNLLTAQNGRSFVCAAGNAGNLFIPFHLGYTAHDDSSFTWMTYNVYIHQVFYDMWVNKEDATTFKFSVGADSISPMKYLGRIKYYNLVNDFNYIANVGVRKDTLFHNGVRVGIITITSFRFDSVYEVDVSVKPDLISAYWRFITGGSGRFDLYSSNIEIGTSDMIPDFYLPDSATFPDIVRYKRADSTQSTTSSFTCSDKVITVANYANRDQYMDYDNLLQTFQTPTGALSPNSSPGPTRDLRIKPDVAAPGDVTLAPGLLEGHDDGGNLVYEMALFIYYQPFKVAQGGMHLRNTGTSMASPVVAGIAALYLQKNPNASWKEIKDAIKLCAFEDSFTGYNLPDSGWGYGKVNAFCALTTPIIYGCMDPSYTNFNPQANVDDGSCSDAVGIVDPSEENSFSCYPNPSSFFTTFFFNLNEAENAYSKILITDVQGKTLDELYPSLQQQHLVYRHHLSSGLYFCSLETSGGIKKVIKLLVE